MSAAATFRAGDAERTPEEVKQDRDALDAIYRMTEADLLLTNEDTDLEG